MHGKPQLVKENIYGQESISGETGGVNENMFIGVSIHGFFHYLNLTYSMMHHIF